MNILLDYLFPITQIDPTPAASTAFLKQVLIVGKPKDGGVTGGVITMCTTIAAVQNLLGTQASLEAQQLFSAGMSRVYVMPMADLNMADELAGHESDFFTILITSDFTDADVIASPAAASATITSFANLVSGTPDSLEVAGVVFTAQAGAATPGTATFQSVTSNNVTAANLAAQINAHATVGNLVTAVATLAVVAITSKSPGTGGNALTLVYVDHDAQVGMTLANATGGHLNGGDGLDLGAFKGVTGVSSTDDTYLAAQAAIANRAAFHTTSGNKAKNMFFAFGKLLSNSLSWGNQQYVTMPFADDVNTLGAANNYFDQRISFIMSDTQYGNRLSFFVAGGKAIVAPYIERNLQIDMQSEALAYISGNQPGYTKTQAALLEDELQKVIDDYIADQWIEAGVVTVTLQQENFVASGNINISEPKALWRIFAEMRQTL